MNWKIKKYGIVLWSLIMWWYKENEKFYSLIFDLSKDIWYINSSFRYLFSDFMSNSEQ